MFASAADIRLVKDMPNGRPVPRVVPSDHIGVAVQAAQADRAPRDEARAQALEVLQPLVEGGRPGELDGHQATFASEGDSRVPMLPEQRVRVGPPHGEINIWRQIGIQ
eukprot:179757-Heterocapsa_arctica.AAC.1